ncbi:MAG: hypothetical protein ACN4GM_16950 [Gammaproteobacteria bacterium]
MANENRAILLDDSIGQGPSFPVSSSFVLDNENDMGIFVDQVFSALFVIDLSTQERVITSWGRKKGICRVF